VGEGAYARSEMWLRRMESRLEGLVGLSGSFFAARKAVCAEWDTHSPSDFPLPAERVIRALDKVIEWRGQPRAIRCDNGPEYVSAALMGWAEAEGISA
jgi:transposase InsO family protein